MISAQKNTPKGIYTIYADFGVGEFLWYKDETETPLIGGNMYSLMDQYYEDTIMSPVLYQAFRDWAELYMGIYKNIRDTNNEYDWDAFNKKGMQLAKKLKLELGDAVIVRYVKPDLDPQRVRGEYIEIKMMEEKLSGR